MNRDGVLIVGSGNELRGDDGAGPVAARRLAALGFDALAVHQLTPEIAERIAAARAVYFIDADARVAPGEIAVEAVTAAPAGRPFEHHSDPAGLLSLAAVAFGCAPEAWLVGIGGSSFEFGEALSVEAERAVARVVSRLA